MNKKEHMEWEMEFPFLASMPRKNAFRVPENYFISARVPLDTQGALATYGYNEKGEGFLVPDSYFSMLSESILLRISLEENRSEDSGFALPAGYFSKLSVNILEKTVEPVKREPKITSLWSSDLMKYASAACVILVAATALFFNQQNAAFNTTATADLYNYQVLYDIDESDIIEHLQS
ncbi:MAG: hypothetical protein EOP48_22575, partial [Sphingobacteriales bacterium]